jgi:hypothetical protein
MAKERPDPILSYGETMDVVETSWGRDINGNPLAWLLEVDSVNPGPRYFTLRDLCDLPEDRPEVETARREIMRRGPVPVILDAQETDGYWVEPGPGYNPKYRATVWSVISLAQLGADPENPRVRRACDYLLDNAVAKTGAFSMNGRPSGTIYCLAGNLIAALIDLDQWNDPRLEAAVEWLARATTGDGMAPPEDKKASPRYLKSGVCGPNFECSANNKLPCAWGALKVMRAFSRIPERSRSPLVRKAIDVGVRFLFSRDPAQADYPMGWSEKPNRSWWKFGFPTFYISDILEVLDVLSTLGHGRDERLDATYQLLIDKQDEQGRWPLEYTYNGKTWVDIEEKGAPSKWVTLRALRALKNRTLPIR